LWMWIWSSFHRSSCTCEPVSWNEEVWDLVYEILYLMSYGIYVIVVIFLLTLLFMIAHPHLLVRATSEHLLPTGPILEFV
jgi:hypothetical protein